MNYLALAMALNAASMAANSYAQQRVNEERSRADRQARKRTEEAYQRAEAARKRGTGEIESTAQRKEEASQSRTEKYQQAQGSTSSAPSLIAPEARGESAAVVSEEDRQRQAARSDTNKAAAARGRIDGLGDVFLGNSLTLADTSRDIRQQGDAAMGWTRNVLPYQLDAANLAGGPAQSLGDLLSMAAQFSAMRGMQPTGGTGTAGVPFSKTGTFAGEPAGIPGINDTPNMPGSGSPWDFATGWEQWAKQFGAPLNRGF